MQKLAALQSGKYYHIYNRGINRENIFFEARNYRYFMDLYARYIEPSVETFAYCLMRNHFHLLVRIKETFEVLETSKVLEPTQQFSNLFNAYAKAINKAYGRTGSLFEGRFGRIEVRRQDTWRIWSRTFIGIRRNTVSSTIFASIRIRLIQACFLANQHASNVTAW